MRTFLISSLMVVAAGLMACGSDSRTPSGGPPVASEEFCNEFVDAVCNNVARCDCSTADADCRSSLTADCGGAGGFFGPEARARVAAGTVRYSETAAGNVIGALRAQTSCENPLVALDWALLEVFTFGGTFAGTLAPGASCAATTGDAPFGGECANGICGDFGGGSLQCIGLAGLGAPCGVGTNVACADLNATFASLESADILLRCNVAPGATTGTCAARLAVGAACTRLDECESTRCEGDVCVARLANGVACDNDNECVSGLCDPIGPTSVCTALGSRPDGDTCSNDSDCSSGACNSVCVPGICSVADSPPSASPPAP